MALISYLILADRVFKPETIYFLKILLSVSVAILFSSVPGMLGIVFDRVPGVAIRAGAGAAAFVIVFFFSPAIPALNPLPPVVKLGSINGLDFRALRGPDPQMMIDSPFAVTVSPISVTNAAGVTPQGYVSATLKKTSISFVLEDENYSMYSEYFVSLVPGPEGTWLSSNGQAAVAQPQTIRAGETLALEVMHIGKSSLKWSDFINKFASLNGDFSLNVTYYIDDQKYEQNCSFNTKPYASYISQYTSKKLLPGYISARCEEI